MDFEIYYRLTGKRQRFFVVKYPLFSNPSSETEMIFKYASRFFHVAKRHIVLRCGWVLDDYLYFDKPKDKKAVKVRVAFVNTRERR